MIINMIIITGNIDNNIRKRKTNKKKYKRKISKFHL